MARFLNDNTMFAFLDGDKIVATARIHFSTSEKTSHIAKITNVYVIPEYRGQKLGQQLIQKIEEFAKSKSVEIIVLCVLSDNIPAIKLYQNLGFVKTGDLPKAMKYNNQYFDEIHMQKEI